MKHLRDSDYNSNDFKNTNYEVILKGSSNGDDNLSKSNDDDSSNMLQKIILEIISQRVPIQKFRKSKFPTWVSTNLK